ncbi:hypothetical protein ACFOX0_24150 [Micromonospora zhanjiangensis]|uniref:Uncharacterized protein n=1 Tax=Micromonospora zhanjiangensis TaxID=1522057 RepID=A0ABV8KSA7_9ACTN
MVLPVPDAPLMMAPRRAEICRRLSCTSSRPVDSTCRIVGVFTRGSSAW